MLFTTTISVLLIVVFATIFAVLFGMTADLLDTIFLSVNSYSHVGKSDTTITRSGGESSTSMSRSGPVVHTVVKTHLLG